jgi:hypothetical protein
MKHLLPLVFFLGLMAASQPARAQYIVQDGME